MTRLSALAWLCLLICGEPLAAAEALAPSSAFKATIRQVTSGPRHHFFGYFGHVQTIPWNQSGRYLLALRTGFQERMPAPDEAAEIVLLDTQNNYASRVVDRT